MKTDKEFRDEVYARASKERARIKRRNRVIMTAVPCYRNRRRSDSGLLFEFASYEGSGAHLCCRI